MRGYGQKYVVEGVGVYRTLRVKSETDGLGTIVEKERISQGTDGVGEESQRRSIFFNDGTTTDGITELPRGPDT